MTLAVSDEDNDEAEEAGTATVEDVNMNALRDEIATVCHLTSCS